MKSIILLFLIGGTVLSSWAAPVAAPATGGTAAPANPGAQQTPTTRPGIAPQPAPGSSFVNPGAVPGATDRFPSQQQTGINGLNGAPALQPPQQNTPVVGAPANGTVPGTAPTAPGAQQQPVAPQPVPGTSFVNPGAPAVSAPTNRFPSQQQTGINGLNGTPALQNPQQNTPVVGAPANGTVPGIAPTAPGAQQANAPQPVTPANPGASTGNPQVFLRSDGVLAQVPTNTNRPAGVAPTAPGAQTPVVGAVPGPRTTPQPVIAPTNGGFVVTNGTAFRPLTNGVPFRTNTGGNPNMNPATGPQFDNRVPPYTAPAGRQTPATGQTPTTRQPPPTNPER